MAELDHEAEETKNERGMAVSGEGAATPPEESTKPNARGDARQSRSGHRRLVAALLACLVVALVALGVWAIQTAGGSASLKTVAPEETKADGDKADVAHAQSSGQPKREATGQAVTAKPEQQNPTSQPAQPQPASDSAASQDVTAGDPVVTTTVVEEPAPVTTPAPESVPDAAPAPEPAPETPAVIVEEPAPAPAPEPTTMTIRVSIDGTPAGGGYRDATVTLSPGASAYDALLASGAGVNARGSVYGTYVAAIDGLAEKDHGGMSGWVYAVNGVEPQTACSNYKLSDGDVVAWLYVNVEY